MTCKKRSNIPYDPTQEEIAEAARLIREGWDERTELARRCVSNPEAVIRVVRSWSSRSDSSFDTFYRGAE